MKALFLDRDGVVNVDTGHVHKQKDFVFCQGLFDVLRHPAFKDFAIIVVTNQAGIAKGLYTAQDYADLTSWMVGEFKRNNVEILDVLHCPHHPEGTIPELSIICHCRKPLPGLLQTAIAKHGISPKESFMIGDRESDMKAAAAAGVGNRILLSDEASLSSTQYFANLVKLCAHLQQQRLQC